MKTPFSLTSAGFVLALMSVLSACSAPKPSYQLEQFNAGSSPYVHQFPAKAAVTCEAARRALLSQGYIATSTRFDLVEGTKNFQSAKESHAVIDFHVVCTSDDPGSNTSTAYVNAVQDQYSLKKSNTSASVGLSVFGSLSLPIGSSDDAMVKIASETIPPGVFYDRFFALVGHYIDAAAQPAAAGAPPKPALPSMDDALPAIKAAPSGGSQNSATDK
jgi:hypothetical protein